MDIKEFRIVEDAMYGFYIQRNVKAEEKQIVKVWWIFTITKKIEVYKWKRISSNGEESRYFSVLRYYREPLYNFETKQEAIDYLEKLCTPDKFYYPETFEEAQNG